MENLYVFAIGGTGARCLESLVFLSAMGLGPSKVVPILIDPDSGNGNLNKTMELINLYREIKKNINSDQPTSMFYTEFEEINYWNPLRDDLEDAGRSKNLKDLLNYNKLDINDKLFVDLFYSKEELELDLDYGFRGVPAIGAVVMQKITEEDFYKKLISKIETDPKKNKAFIFSSIFGGTGASGYPTIAKLISEIGESAIGGGSVIFPYFQLPKNKSEEKIAPNSDEFIINAKSAIPYYKKLGELFTNYIIGDDIFSDIIDYQIGGVNQINKSHFIELFAALAALDFNFNNRRKGFLNIKKLLQNNDLKSPIIEDDLPDPKKQGISFIGSMERFSIFSIYFNDLFCELDGKNEKKINKVLKSLTWLKDNIDIEVDDIMDNKKDIEKVLRFIKRFKDWHAEMQNNERSIKIMDKELKLSNLLHSNPNKYTKKRIDYLDRLLVQSQNSNTNVIDKIVNAIQKGTTKFQKINNK